MKLCGTYINKVLLFVYIFLFLDRERIALGTEEGLFVVEVTRDGTSHAYSLL